MSLNIWTRCEGKFNFRSLEFDAWRIVEAQDRVSTLKLVDSLADQSVLEDMLDASKPKDPAPRLHYLLKTPFRYPPLRHGSRFGTRLQRGIWYGSLESRTAFAEAAYYRLLFLEGTKANIPRMIVELTAFQAHIRSEQAIDLSLDPFQKYRRNIASKTTYAASQALGQAMRNDHVEVFLFPSARDHEGGSNCGVFDPGAISSRRPKSIQRWTGIVSRDRVEFSRQHFFDHESFQFKRSQFEVRGTLPGPAV